ncbi:MAG: DUF5671 domain-containing protein [Minisyncoccota bacterium]
MNNKITAKDFFLHLGAIVSFYASVIALITLLFEVINFAYPRITNAYYYAFPSISFQVATLIVALPLFLGLSWLIQKTYVNEPALRDSWLRKWLAYITLFVAGAIVAGDLVTVIYMFLDGQELTTGFLLKVLVLLSISLGVFAYYLREIRNVIEVKERNIWRGLALILTIASVVLGFMVIGSPKAQREYRYDMQKENNLQDIQWQVTNYWQMKGALPTALTDLNDSLKPGIVPKDPQTGEDYTYRSTGALSFELCAEFNRESRTGIAMGGNYLMERSVYDTSMAGGENWQHEAGQHCFERTIDPELYPKITR